MEVLATVSISGSQSNNDVLRHWLAGNGYTWEYDHYGRLTFAMHGTQYRAAFKYLGDDTVRIYAILV